MAGAAEEWGAQAYPALKAAGVRQVAYVPDGGLTNLIGLCAADGDMRTILLSSEEEGIGLVAGAWLGGDKAALLMQSSGVGNCINALSLIRTGRFPCLAIVTMRGEWREFNPWQLPMGQNAAAYLERAGAVVYRADAREAVAETVASAATLAFETQSAVAVLIGQRLIGVKRFQD